MPNRITFTQLAIERISPPSTGRDTYWDRNLPGFGLRVAAPRPGSRDGRKTWIAMGRVDGKPVMATLGTTARIPKLADARDLARAAILKMRAGTKPLDERRAEHERKAAETKAAAAAEREAAEGRFDAVAERFLATRGIGIRSRKRAWAPKYAKEFRRIIEHDVPKSWRTRPIRSITKADVNALLNAKAAHRERVRKGSKGGAAVQANRVLSRLKTLFLWAETQELIDKNPIRGVTSPGEELPRERVLSDQEIVALWHAADAEPWPGGSILQLLLATAQRRGEVAGMRWSEIDRDERVWNIAAERTKSRRAHVVHLSQLAIDIIDKLPRLGGDLVFPTRNGSPFNGFDRTTRHIAAAMGCDDWIIHDLRRTATTIMAGKLKIAPHVADKILNHASATAISSTAAIYNRALYLDERKAALEALGRYIDALVRPGGAGNVVPLAARA